MAGSFFLPPSTSNVPPPSPPASPSPPKVKSIVYIDGFNLYYGAIRGGPYKWLDLQKYFTLLRQGDDIQQIHYFTALVNGPDRVHQETYLKALDTFPLLNIILGKFKTKQIKCTLVPCTVTGSRLFVSQEEKRTDVNIAIQILDDAYQNRCERFVIVSGDSDLVPAINMVKALFPHKEVIVYIPTRNAVRGAATEIRSAADKDRTLPLNMLRLALLPPALPDGSGGTISKPAGW